MTADHAQGAGTVGLFVAGKWIVQLMKDKKNLESQIDERDDQIQEMNNAVRNMYERLIANKGMEKKLNDVYKNTNGKEYGTPTMNEMVTEIFKSLKKGKKT